MQYVIRTRKLTDPHWFAGSIEGGVMLRLCIAQTIFDAWHFDNKAEAEQLAAALGWADWTVSEIGEPGMSANLAGRQSLGAPDEQ